MTAPLAGIRGKGVLRRFWLALPLGALPMTPAAAQTDTEAARAVVRHYYEAIAHHDYRRAYAAWGNGGRASRQSYAAFARGFANTAQVTVATGPVPRVPEGAAGSLYVTVPVDVRARLHNGGRQHFRGNYVVRRVNNVPGAAPDMLQWHIVSAHLLPVR